MSLTKSFLEIVDPPPLLSVFMPAGSDRSSFLFFLPILPYDLGLSKEDEDDVLLPPTDRHFSKGDCPHRGSK